jgi:CNT family concentrative nucleoside transporter
MDVFSVLRGLFGLAVIIAIAYLFSNNKKGINWRLVGNGLIIQLIFAIFIIQSENLRHFFFPLGWVKDAINSVGIGLIALLNFTSDGAKFVFGNLAGGNQNIGFIFAFQVLPTIIFLSSLTAVLYHLNILQAVVKGMAWFFAKILGTSGAESLNNTANIFVGQTEAPLFIRPYIPTLTSSELLAIMIGGLATISGGAMASYVQILGQAYSEYSKLGLQESQLKFAVHLLAGSTMAAPASLVISKILFPENGSPLTKGTVKLKIEKSASNVIDAAATGAGMGLQLALNVGGMLIAFIALIALVNSLLTGLGNLGNLNAVIQAKFGQPLSMQLICGLGLQYVAMAIGVPVSDAFNFGSLTGTKVVLNEFVAYVDLAKMIKSGLLTEKGILMTTYSLCGFANFGSIAILIGGIGPMAPERKHEIASLGLKAVLGGSLATLMTATLAGIMF